MAAAGVAPTTPTVSYAASAGVITSGGLYTAPSNPPSAASITVRVAGKVATVPVGFVQSDIGATFAIGLSQWPQTSYCTGPMTATMQPLDPSEVLPALRKAYACGFRVVVVPPRKFLTSTGAKDGPFQLANAKAATDAYARVLPADTLAKYHQVLLGFNLGDDYPCASCWGGAVITPAEIAAWASYTKPRLPGLPLGVRVLPSWAPASDPLWTWIDYAWAQWHQGKSATPGPWYDQAVIDARARGIRLVIGVNVADCGGNATPPCTSAELVKYGTLAVLHPGSCAMVNWMFDDATWQRADIRAAWDSLVTAAASRPAQECRR